MSIPAQSGVQWSPIVLRGSNRGYTVTFTGASQVTEPLELYDLPIQTVHIFGTFNGQTVTLQGTNSLAAAANLQNLHRINDTTATFATVGAELLAGIDEGPIYLVAKSDGAVTSVTIVVIGIDRKHK